MTDSMNIPEIETLSYHSSLCKCKDCNKPASASREAKEKTTLDIEPKTGVEMFANKSGGVLANPEQPNQ